MNSIVFLRERMMPAWLGVAIALAGLSGLIEAETVTLTPSQDTSIFSEDGSLSNGAGSFFFAGLTQGRQGAGLRRALFQFDLSGLPEGANVSEVKFRVTADRGSTGTLTVHRLLTGWGEAGSNAGSPGGLGAPAQPGDATWTQNRFGESTWTTAGGDFLTTASASAAASSAYEWSGDGMKSDVMHWLGEPSVNFGWIVLGEEGRAGSARRLVSPTLIVEFTLPAVQRTLTLEAEPPEGGAVSGGGTFAEGSEVAITATAQAGYVFAGWSGVGVADTGAASTTVLLDADKTVVAQFTRVQRTLTLEADPPEGGAVSGGGTFAEGSEVAITATAQAGYVFAGWSGVGVTDTGAASTTVLLDADKTVVAQFTRVQRTLTLVADPPEGGAVSGGGSFAEGSEVAITATAQAGYVFAGWSGVGVADTGAASTTVLLDADKTVVAQFTRVQRTLTLEADPPEGGAVSGGGTFAEGSEVAITATAQAGYVFAGWSGVGVADTGAASTTVLLDADKTVVAQFTRVQRTLTLEADPPEGGAVSGGGTFAEGSEVAITATAQAGYVFAGWSGVGVADTGAASTTVLLDADKTVVAQFQLLASDADGDGMNDRWEEENGLDPNNPADADSDGDGDGATAVEEYRARTDPRDRDSVLEVVEATIVSEGRVRLRWLSVAGVRYRLQRSIDLTPAGWDPGTEVLAEGEETSAEVSFAGPRVFFRLSVTRSPEDF